MSNSTIVLLQLITQGLQNLMPLQQLYLKVQREGRDVTEDEIRELGALGEAYRQAAREEADRQRNSAA